MSRVHLCVVCDEEGAKSAIYKEDHIIYDGFLGLFFCRKHFNQLLACEGE